MKKISFIFLLFFFNNILIYAQSDLYKYFIHMTTYKEASSFKKVDDRMIYFGENAELQVFFQKHMILEFHQAFPSSPREKDRNVFYVETTDQDFIKSFKEDFFRLYTFIEDISKLEIELAFYPNDYGPTSPTHNNGVFNRSELDYMGAPKAWDITTGLGTTIVLSDARINENDPDFSSKLTFYKPCPCQNYAYDPNNLYTFHGTGVASFSATQGNNNHGTTGICYDCNIIMTDFGIGALNNLLELAEMGYRVFNMSWIYFNNSPTLEGVINTLVEVYDVILVASAGNRISYQTNEDFIDARWNSSLDKYTPQYTGIQYGYPASYDNVISVTNINHSFLVNDPIAPPNVFWSNSIISAGQSFVRDSFSPNVDISDPQNPIGLIYNGYPRTLEKPSGGNQVISPNGLTRTNASNEKIDILASSDLSMVYHKYSELGLIEYIDYAGTTSQVAPMVSATAALMITINECLTASEVKQIIKLTSKDVESLFLNNKFKGKIGAGSLQIDKAVEFSNEIKKTNGNAIIQDHTFRRWKFNLKNINNNLIIKNVQFIENVSVHFVAKKSILIEENTLLEIDYNSSDLGSSIILEVDSSINASCD